MQMGSPTNDLVSMHVYMVKYTTKTTDSVSQAYKHEHIVICDDTIDRLDIIHQLNYLRKVYENRVSHAAWPINIFPQICYLTTSTTNSLVTNLSNIYQIYL